jgi:hypothetical protein
VGGFSVCDTYFDLPQHRHDLLCFVPFDRHVAAQAFQAKPRRRASRRRALVGGCYFLYCENGGLLTCGKVPLFLALFDEENHSSLSGHGPEPRQIVFNSVPERDAVARAEIFFAAGNFAEGQEVEANHLASAAGCVHSASTILGV